MATELDPIPPQEPYREQAFAPGITPRDVANGLGRTYNFDPKEVLQTLEAQGMTTEADKINFETPAQARYNAQLGDYRTIARSLMPHPSNTLEELTKEYQRKKQDHEYDLSSHTTAPHLAFYALVRYKGWDATLQDIYDFTEQGRYVYSLRGVGQEAGDFLYILFNEAGLLP